MTGPGAVKGERMGLSPLAVQQLADEFRRLAAEAQRRSEQHVQHANQSGALSAMGKATVWRQAAQMLEEKLNG